jgi:hypothetical protein
MGVGPIVVAFITAAINHKLQANILRSQCPSIFPK